MSDNASKDMVYSCYFLCIVRPSFSPPSDGSGLARVIFPFALALLFLLELPLAILSSARRPSSYKLR